jgi:hypothetical protein
MSKPSEPYAACYQCNLYLNKDKVSHWISVKDRLPECHKEVLTFCRGGVNIWHLAINGPDVKGKHCIMWAGGLPVSHWMPLPEPPKDYAASQPEKE